ncbi:MAG: hypothetical protein WD535_00920 [Thermaerobacterales bacterium]
MVNRKGILLVSIMLALAAALSPPVLFTITGGDIGTMAGDLIPGWKHPGGRSQAVHQSAAADRQGVRVTLLLAAGLDWSDLLAMSANPRLARYLESAHVGLLNVATGDSMLPEHAYATAAAGIRAIAAPEAGHIFAAHETHAGQPAVDLYRQRVGRGAGASQQTTGDDGPEPAESLFHTGLAPLQYDNQVLNHGVRFGRLAARLQQQNIRSLVVGNADLPNDPARHAALLVMDEQGLVESGVMGGSILRQVDWMPGGAATDWTAVAAIWHQAPHDLQIIESGDLWRLERSRRFLTPAAYASARERAMAELVGGWTGILDRLAAASRPHRFILASPAPPRTSSRPQGLGWIAVWDSGGATEPAPGGFIISDTTRRAGLASLVDLLPSLLSALGADDREPAWTGRPIRSTPAAAEPVLIEQRLRQLDRLQDAVTENHRRRNLLIQSFILATIIIVITALGAIFAPRARPYLTGSLRPLLLFIAAVPLLYLLLPLLPGQGATAAVIWTLLLGAGFVLAVLRRPPEPSYLPFVVIACFTVIILVLDLMWGAHLVIRSPLGYTLIGGARYYGIGNEYMGIILGSAAMGSTGILQALRVPITVGRLVLALFLGLIVLLMGAPMLGANFGGALSSAVLLAVTLFGLGQTHLNLRVIGLALITLVITGLLTAGLDLFRVEGTSHVGLAARRLLEGDWGGLADLIRRKWAINMKLIRWTVWSRVLLVTLGGTLLLAFKPAGLYQRLLGRYPYLRAGMAGASVASVAALVLNDSGVVAAAATMVLPTTTVLYMAFFDPYGVSAADS